MLLPSPIHAIVILEKSFPFVSATVCISANNWQGWKRLHKPLITGTEENFASFLISSWVFVLIIIKSTIPESTWAVSEISSPLFNCEESSDKNIACPPNLYIAVSNDTLVLVEFFLNIIANVLFKNGLGILFSLSSSLKSIALWIIFKSSWVFISIKDLKSLLFIIFFD